MSGFFPKGIYAPPWPLTSPLSILCRLFYVFLMLACNLIEQTSRWGLPLVSVVKVQCLLGEVLQRCALCEIPDPRTVIHGSRNGAR